MAEDIKEILKRYFETYKEDGYKNEKRCESYLKDFCGEKKKEIFMLVSAIKENIPEKLILSSSDEFLLNLEAEKSANMLIENLGFSRENSDWIVDTWGYAMSLKFKTTKSYKLEENQRTIIQNNIDQNSIKNDTKDFLKERPKKQENIAANNKKNKSIFFSESLWIAVLIFSFVAIGIASSDTVRNDELNSNLDGNIESNEIVESINENDEAVDLTEFDYDLEDETSTEENSYIEPEVDDVKEETFQEEENQINRVEEELSYISPYLEDMVSEYVYCLTDAINYNDFSIVSHTIITGSELYSMQEELVDYLNEKQITEEILDFRILDIAELTDGNYEVKTYEKMNIYYSDGYSEVKEYNWTYTLSYNEQQAGLTNIRSSI